MPRITQLLEQTSRTFAIGMRHLPSGLRDTVSVAYLLLRVADYFEDNEDMPPGEKIGWLERWAAAVRSASDGEAVSFDGPSTFDEATPDAAAARAAGFVLESFARLPSADRDVLGHHIAESTLGMARWVGRGPDFGTEDDLDDYMFEVAGRVGLLLTDLFALRSAAVRRSHEEMAALGVEFGLGLQTVNVVRGLSADPSRGWIFLPRSFLPAGVAPAALWDDPEGEAATALLDRLCDKAERHLEGARAYVLGIPRREYGTRVFCLLPLLFALRTVELSRGDPDVFRREVKLGRGEVRAIARRTRLMAPSNRWVRGVGSRSPRYGEQRVPRKALP